jgi:putative transposase
MLAILCRVACLTMVHKLMRSAERKSRVLSSSSLLPDVIAGVKFIDGENETKQAA